MKLREAIVAIAIVIVYVSVKERKVPAGILEWLFLIGAFAIISASAVGGCSGILGWGDFEEEGKR